MCLRINLPCLHQELSQQTMSSSSCPCCLVVNHAREHVNIPEYMGVFQDVHRSREPECDKRWSMIHIYLHTYIHTHNYSVCRDHCHDQCGACSCSPQLLVLVKAPPRGIIRHLQVGIINHNIPSGRCFNVFIYGC